jgi:hypothetical protein
MMDAEVAAPSEEILNFEFVKVLLSFKADTISKLAISYFKAEILIYFLYHLTIM